MRIIGNMKRILTALLLAVALPLAAKPALFPDTVPPEFKKMKLRDKEVCEIAPGVTYYHYHFDNVLPKNKVPFYKVSRIYIHANGKARINGGKKLSPEDAAKQEAAAQEKIAILEKELKNKKNFHDAALKYSDDPGAKAKKPNLQFPVIEIGGGQVEPELEEAIKKLKKPGDISDVVKTEKGYYFLRLDKVIKEMPVSVFYVVIDWEKANVKFKLGHCGKRLKTVREMVQDDKTLAAVNGAYFSWVPLSTYYPFKFDGNMILPKKPYDSRIGMCFKDGEFPVLDIEENYDKYDNVIVGYHIWKNKTYSLSARNDHWTQFAAGSTPLTAVGFNFEKKRVVLMTSDGRFPDDAPGLNFYTLGYMLSIMGCTDVLSVDGGGSCTMIIREGRKLSDPKNHPSDNRRFDHGGARSVYNCIYLVEGDKEK